MTTTTDQQWNTESRWDAVSQPGPTVELRTIEIPVREVQVGDLVTDTSGHPMFWVTKIGEGLTGNAFGPYTEIWWEMTYCCASANGHVERDYPTAIFGNGEVTIVDTIG